MLLLNTDLGLLYPGNIQIITDFGYYIPLVLTIPLRITTSDHSVIWRSDVFVDETSEYGENDRPSAGHEQNVFHKTLYRVRAKRSYRRETNSELSYMRESNSKLSYILSLIIQVDETPKAMRS